MILQKNWDTLRHIFFLSLLLGQQAGSSLLAIFLLLGLPGPTIWCPSLSYTVVGFTGSVVRSGDPGLTFIGKLMGLLASPVTSLTQVLVSTRSSSMISCSRLTLIMSGLMFLVPIHILSRPTGVSLSAFSGWRTTHLPSSEWIRTPLCVSCEMWKTQFFVSCSQWGCIWVICSIKTADVWPKFTFFGLCLQLQQASWWWIGGEMAFMVWCGIFW